MTDRPILFSAPMVRALLDGRKTQTRRLLPNPEYYGCPTGDCPHNRQEECNQAMRENTAPDLRFAVGDRLWVKETWQTLQGFDHLKPTLLKRDAPIGYFATPGLVTGGKTRVSIHMPRWASRLTLIVTDVRVERLQDISEADAIAEGAFRQLGFDADPAKLTYRNGYRSLWNSINGGPGKHWSDNPWIVAVTFAVEKRNIDQ